MCIRDRIIGPYLGEIAAKMSVFDFNNNTILVKLQIPVRISEWFFNLTIFDFELKLEFLNLGIDADLVETNGFIGM